MALDFNGSNQYDQVADASSIDLGDEFTLCGWLNTDNKTIFYQTIMCKKSGGSSGNYHIAIYNDQLVLGFFSGGLKEGVSDAFSFADTTNTHWAITFSKPTVTFYKNGVQLGATKSVNFTPTANNEVLWIGYDNATYGNAFNGRLWDTMIYNRALSASEIKIIYESKGVDNITNGRVLYHRMNEKPTGGTASGAGVIIDLSGYGNHGTPANSPVYYPKPIRSIK
jgi:hypothetical protein